MKTTNDLVIQAVNAFIAQKTKEGKRLVKQAVLEAADNDTKIEFMSAIIDHLLNHQN